MKKTVIASAVALGMGLGIGTGVAGAAVMSSGTFSGWSPYGLQINPTGNDTTISGSIGGGTWSVSSTKKLWDGFWTAHGGTTFGPGTYTIDTSAGGMYTNIVVGPGQVGGHILFDFGSSGGLYTNLDIINVWNVSGNSYTSVPVSIGGTSFSDATHCVDATAGIRPGIKAVDGFLQGNCLNFDFRVVPVPSAVWLFGSGLVGLIGVARRRKAA